MPHRSYASTANYRFGYNGKENDNESKGLGNQQDYGMRIYDPRLGKFLSIDPISAKYPWYTPYQFAGNKPIRFIDLDGMEESEIVQKYLPFAQDMSNTPTYYTGVSGRVVQTTYNLHGWGVNSLYFWENNITQHPEFLDPWNKGRVLIEGRSPIFTLELQDNFVKNGISTRGLRIGDILEHHHISQGKIAIPITSDEHDQIPVQKNESKVKISSRPGRITKLANKLGLPAMVGAEVFGGLSGNPDSWINLFGKRQDLGVVYKQAESNLFYTIVSKDVNENSGTNYFWVYSSAVWDKELKKYVGANPVGYGETYSEKGGYTRTVVYDLNGKVKSYDEKGSKKGID